MHGMCVTRQQLYFDGRIEASRYPAISVSDMARGLGSQELLWVASASTKDELSSRLVDYRAQMDRPRVLELQLGREQIPPFSPFLSSDAPTYLAEPFVGV
jgi:acetolactate synthase-1/2/3 large subunit